MDANMRKNTRKCIFYVYLNVCMPIYAPETGKKGHNFRLSSESVMTPLALSNSSAVLTSLTRKTT